MTTATNAKKAPAKKAPTKAPATEAPAAARKLRWVMEEEGRKGKEPWPSSSASVDGYVYRISRGDVEKQWIATVTHEGVTETLSDSSFGKAYGACLAHHRAR